MKYLSLSLCLFAFGLLTSSALAEVQAEGSSDVSGYQSLRGIGVPFVENLGQHPPEVRFYAETFAGTFFVMRDGGMWLAVPNNEGPDNEAQVIQQTLVAQNASPPRGLRESVTKVHLSVGPDPRKWRSNIPAFDVITMGEVYDGIELRLAASGRNVEQLYFVRPEADPARIHVRLDGAKATRGKHGDLELRTAAGNLSLSKPVAYQVIDGARQSVKVAYVVTEDGYGFSLGPYDRSKELIIDPLLDATYLGGSGSDAVLDMIVHPDNGHVYVAGRTNSASFGSEDEILDDTQAYVARLSSDLTELLAIHFMGGSGIETALALEVFPEGALQAGKLVVAGSTDSTDWPDSGFGPRANDSLFLSSFDVNLEAPLHRWVGGARQDRFGDLAIHPTNFQIYLAGETNSTDFPGTSGGFQADNKGIFDAFVARFGPNLQELLQATYLGGEEGSEVTVSILLAAGAVYVKGRTNSRDDWVFPTAPQPSLGGGIEDLFVAKLDEPLAAATMVTFLGGNGVEETVNSRIVATSDGVYIAGKTSSEGPGTTGIIWTPGAFVVRYTSDLKRTIAPDGMPPFEPYIILTAGLKNILGHSDGNLYMLGTAGVEPKLPETDGTVQPDPAEVGGSDAFVSCLNADLEVQQSTYLGGNGSDTPVDFVESPSSGDLYVLGRTDSFDFPRAVGGARPSNAGPIDAFVARLTPDLSTASDSLSTYFGGAMNEQPIAITVDADSGDVLIAGNTFSSDLPRTGGRAQPTLIAEPDGFVARFDATLAGLEGLPDIDVVPTELSFPATAVGNRFELGLGISNLGEGDLVITEISNSNPTAFVVTTMGGNATCSAALPFTLESGESCIISVAYAPQSEVEHTGTVTITSNDPDEGTVTVPMSGMGLPPGSESSGCACSVPGQSRALLPSAMLLALGVLLWLRLRQRHSV